MSDYMETPNELEKHNQIIPAINEASAGSPEVAAAIWSYWNFAHVFDDLIDGSGWDEQKVEQAMKALHDFVTDLMINPFVVQNARSLHGMFIQSMTRNMDGDSMSRSENPEVRTMSSPVRCGDVDVIFHMAYLAGGWPRLRAMARYRSYDDNNDHNEKG